MSLGDDGRTRIAIVSSDKVRWHALCLCAVCAAIAAPPHAHRDPPLPQCKPKKCKQECKKGCPVVRMGTLPPPAHVAAGAPAATGFALARRLTGPLSLCRQDVRRSGKDEQDRFHL